MPAVFTPTEERQVKHWALRQAIAEAEAKKDTAAVARLRAELTAHKAGRPYVPPAPPKPAAPVPSVTPVTPPAAPSVPRPAPAATEKPGE